MRKQKYPVAIIKGPEMITVSNYISIISLNAGENPVFKGPVKIRRAMLSFQTKSAIRTNKHYIVKDHEGVTIDEFIDDSGSYLFDVTNSLQRCIDSKRSLIVSFYNSVGGTDLDIQSSQNDENKHPVLTIEYESPLCSKDTSAFTEFDLGYAGSGKADLYTGSFSHAAALIKDEGTAGPLTVGLVYNNLLDTEKLKGYSNKDGCAVPDTFNLSPNFKLNLQQYLIKQDKSAHDKSVGVNHIYIDGTGNCHYLTEKYFYEDSSGNKHYIEKDKITINQDGSLEFKTESDISYDIKPETASETGLTLIPEIKDFEKESLDLVETRHEELANAEEEYYRLRNYENDLIYNENELYKQQSKEYKNIEKWQKEIENNNLELEIASYELNNEITPDYNEFYNVVSPRLDSTSKYYLDFIIGDISNAAVELNKYSTWLTYIPPAINRVLTSLSDKEKRIVYAYYLACLKNIVQYKQNILNGKLKRHSAYDYKFESESVLNTLPINIPKLDVNGNVINGTTISASPAMEGYNYIQYINSASYTNQEWLNMRVHQFSTDNYNIAQYDSDNQKNAARKYLKYQNIYNDLIAGMQESLADISDDLNLKNNSLSFLTSKENKNILSKKDAILKLQDNIIKEKAKLNSDKDKLLQDERLQQLIDKNEAEKEKTYKRLAIKEYEIKILKENTPVSYLSDNEGNILGFNASGILVFGASGENQALIEYKNGRVNRAVDKDENFVEFIYNLENRLIKITDVKGKSTSLVYNNSGNLERVIYPELLEDACKFRTYEGDLYFGCGEQSNYLTAYYEYTNGSLSKIKDSYFKSLNFSYDEKLRISAISQKSQIQEVGLSEIKLTNTEQEISGISILYNEKNNSVIIKDEKNNRKAVIFDSLGTPVTEYEADENQGFNVVRTTAFNKLSKDCSISVTPLKSVNLLDNISFSAFRATGGAGYEKTGTYFEEVSTCYPENSLTGGSGYFGEDIFLTSLTVPTSKIQLRGNLTERNKISKEITLQKSGKDYILTFKDGEDGSVTEKRVKREYLNDLVFSVWADGSSLPLYNTKEYRENGGNGGRADRAFNLTANVEYSDSFIKTFTCDFSPSFEGWQKAIVPLAVDLNYNGGPVKITLDINLDYTSGLATFACFSLRHADYVYSEFDEKGLKTTETDGLNSVSYIYDKEERLTEAVLKDKTGEHFHSYFYYDKTGKCVKERGFDGMVTETLTDEEEKTVKKVTYHYTDPSSKQIEEYKNEPSVKTHPSGLKESRGADSAGNTLSVSYSNGNEENKNLLCYSAGLLTGISSDGFSADFAYDHKGRRIKTLLGEASENAVTIQFDDTRLTAETSYNTADKCISSFDPDGNLKELEFNKKTILKNTFDEFGNIKFSIDMSSLSGYTEYKRYNYDEKQNVTRAETESENTLLCIQNEYSEEDKPLLSEISLSKTGESTAETLLYNYGYDTKGGRSFINEITLTNNFRESVETDNFGRLTHIALTPSGSKNPFTKDVYYCKSGDAVTPLISSLRYGVNGTILDNLSYTYDESGNIISVKENGSVIQRFAYDNAGRLTREDNKKLSETYSFTYGINGNTESKNIYDFTLNKDLEESGVLKERIIYAYENSAFKDRLTALKHYLIDGTLKEENFISNYTGIGNPKNYKNYSFEWERIRLLSGINSAGGNVAKYRYNFDGIRNLKTVNGVETTYYLNGTKILREENDKQTIWYTYSHEGVAGFKLKKSGETNYTNYYYRKNLQGDVTHIYKSGGELAAAYTYDAWGKVTVENFIGDIGDINPYRYRSYYYDVETGFYSVGLRYYDPEVGRWINADSVEYIEPGIIGGLNLYAYCLNNPVMLTDSTGCSPFWDIFAAIGVGLLSVGAIVGGIILTATGIGAPLGAILIGAGAGGLIGMGGSFVSQGLSNGWGNINWGQVAFNGAIGMATGALMASPLGAVATGFAVGGLGFTQSVGNDLFESGGDWSQVNWGRAVTFGVVSGLIAGGGKYLTNNVTLMNKFVNSSSAVKSLGAQSLKLGLAGRQTYTSYWMNVMIAQTVYRSVTSVGMNMLRGGLRGLINLLW